MHKKKKKNLNLIIDGNNQKMFKLTSRVTDVKNIDKTMKRMCLLNFFDFPCNFPNGIKTGIFSEQRFLLNFIFFSCNLIKKKKIVYT